MTDVLHVRAFADNYIWLIRGKSPDRVAIVDPGDADPVLAALEKQRLTPVAVLCTHHHGDHVGGVEDILRHYSVPVYGPARERIPTLTHRLKDGDHINIAELDLEFDVLDVPGHTAGHIAFVGGGMLFCGDTLFSAGCGRLFEGTAEQMHASLSRFAALPEASRVYCGHEYTESNLRFALTLEAKNHKLMSRFERVQGLRARGLSTVPSTLEEEKQTNPFLRWDSKELQSSLRARFADLRLDPVSVFARVRQLKDSF